MVGRIDGLNEHPSLSQRYGLSVDGLPGSRVAGGCGHVMMMLLLLLTKEGRLRRRGHHRSPISRLVDAMR